MMKFLLAELLCVVMIALGVGWWIAPGAGLVAAGILGLLLVFAAQIPTGGDV